MRPTLLGFRSAKEKTPSYYDSKNTYDGRSLLYFSAKGQVKRGSFSLERRFNAYEVLSKRTGYRVGPGSYSPETLTEKVKGGSPYKNYHCQQKTENNGYYMVGDCLHFEPSWLLARHKPQQRETSINKDSTYIQDRMARTAISTSNSLNLDFEKKKEPEKLAQLTARVEKKRPRKVRKLNKSMQIESLLKRRFN